MAKFNSMADCLGAVPEVQHLISPAPDFSKPGTKVLTVKVSGPDSERIATVLWQSLHDAARKLNQHKSPNVVNVEANV